ncbi:MAG TPA: hypothetical protein PLL78_10315 [Fimbriimonadaceae bacterium]|nr:hypothetical protein [Fimbriimonadaceae bacterium]
MIAPIAPITARIYTLDDLVRVPIVKRSASPVFDITGAPGTCLGIATAVANASMIDSTAGGVQLSIASGTTSTTHTVASTAGLVNGQTLWFGTAGVSRTLSSFVVNTSITVNSSFTSTTNEVFGVVGDTYKMAMAMAYNDRPRRIQGIGVIRTSNMPSGVSLDLNLSLWPNKINTNDWNPDTAGLINPSAWGTVNIPNITGSVRAFAAPLQATIDMPIGYFWYGCLRKWNTGIGGGFRGVALERIEGLQNSSTAGYSRYDQQTTATIQYVATTPNGLLSGKSFDDQAQALTTRAENMEYFLLAA